MKQKFAKLPVWKCYLYTLHTRIRLFKSININRHDFGFSYAEKRLLFNMVGRYVSKGVVIRGLVIDKYLELINNPLKLLMSQKEIEIIRKISFINKINKEDLIMELAEIKKFGKEVGLNALKMAKMTEEQLVIEIVKAVDGSKSYSADFIAWYEELPQEIFGESEESNGKESTGALDDNLKELLEIINDTEKKEDLLEIAKDDDFKKVFAGLDFDKFKTATALKKALVGAIKGEKEEPTKAEPKTNGNAKKAAVKLDIDDDLRKELIDVVNAIEDEDALITLLSDDDLGKMFESVITIDENIDVESVKTQLLAALNPEVAEEPKAEEKPMTLKERLAAKKAAESGNGNKTAESNGIVFDPKDFNPEEVYEKAVAASMPLVRKFAKEIGIVAPPGSKKDDILSLIAEKLDEIASGTTASEDVSESNETDDVEINTELVQAAIDANDIESLTAIADALGVTLNAIQKRSVKLAGPILLNAAKGAEKPKEEPKTGKKGLTQKTTSEPAKSNDESKSLYQTMQEMVIGGANEKTIIDAVTPAYKERGKNLMFIRKRVKQMIEIIKQDFDL